ncbi:hypothetical protein VTI74DRAFT_6597 [Chaetomium olivicolor]
MRFSFVVGGSGAYSEDRRGRAFHPCISPASRCKSHSHSEKCEENWSSSPSVVGPSSSTSSAQISRGQSLSAPRQTFQMICRQASSSRSGTATSTCSTRGTVLRSPVDNTLRPMCRASLVGLQLARRLAGPRPDVLSKRHTGRETGRQRAQYRAGEGVAGAAGGEVILRQLRFRGGTAGSRMLLSRNHGTEHLLFLLLSSLLFLRRSELPHTPASQTTLRPSPSRNWRHTSIPHSTGDSNRRLHRRPGPHPPQSPPQLPFYLPQPQQDQALLLSTLSELGHERGRLALGSFAVFGIQAFHTPMPPELSRAILIIHHRLRQVGNSDGGCGGGETRLHRRELLQQLTRAQGLLLHAVQEIGALVEELFHGERGLGLVSRRCCWVASEGGNGGCGGEGVGTVVG